MRMRLVGVYWRQQERRGTEKEEVVQQPAQKRMSWLKGLWSSVAACMASVACMCLRMVGLVA